MNQSEKRQFLIHELLKEAPEFQGLSVPSDSEGQKQLLRGLMNIRPPRKCSREFLEMLFASPEVSALLEVNPGYPLLRLEQVNYDSRDIPQSFVQILFRGDRTRLHFDYNRPESRPDVQIFQ